MDKHKTPKTKRIVIVRRKAEDQVREKTAVIITTIACTTLVGYVYATGDIGTTIERSNLDGLTHRVLLGLDERDNVILDFPFFIAERCVGGDSNPELRPLFDRPVRRAIVLLASEILTLDRAPDVLEHALFDSITVNEAHTTDYQSTH